MSKETRFCPFMRKLTREHWRTAQDRVAESYKDRFGKCIGEKYPYPLSDKQEA